MNDDLILIFKCLILPGLVSLSANLVAWRPWRKTDRVENGHWGWALGLGGGYAAGQVALTEWPAFPPPEASQWLIYFSLSGMILGIGLGLRAYSAWIDWSLRTVLLGAVLPLLMWARIHYAWTLLETVFWLAGMGMAGLVQWWHLSRLAGQEKGGALPFFLAWLSMILGIVLFFSGSLKLAQFGMVLGAALGGGLGVAWWHGKTAMHPTAFPVFVPLYFGLILIGYFYAEMPVASALLLMGAPALVWISRIKRFLKSPSWVRYSMTGLAVLVVSLLSVYLAWQAYGATKNDDSGYGAYAIRNSAYRAFRHLK